MKKNNILIMTAGLLLSAVTAGAQEIVVKDKIVEKAGSALVMGMTLDLSQIRLAGNRSIVCTPVIVRGDSIRPLAPVIINGRSRHILYERTGRNRQENQEIELRRRNGKEQTVDYQVRTPYASWMNNAEVALVTDECGCGWEAMQSNRSPLFAIQLEKPIMTPFLCYQTPKMETVKARAKEGSAFLDFPVGKTTIAPDYRDNRAELAKIRETVESVRNDPYATITEVYIKGFASPEGSYKSNSYLAENRAKALSDYVKGLYHFDRATFTVDFEPEDWDGLAAHIETSGLADKAELLDIIRADQPADLDQKEWKLKTLNGGASYPAILRDIYPSLRHSDYAVKYTIRNFSVEEAKELIYTDPKQLSLDEMFRVAQTYEPGSDQYNEVFEIAVRMYPDDPVSNLNAANTAIGNKQLAQAKRYLSKAADSPEKQLAEASIVMLEGDLDRAEQLLDRLKGTPSVSEAVEKNLEQIRLWRE
ncbi:DUF3868 domain-containing protein [Parabacteroides faecis]|uniref:Outer membrane protein OmpA-like peptidoglycan-associated protein n=1 Tax=Parabacteroides faecis TaxID=1217282 RepID=A0ABR6KWE5_9BACT|nr:outer membrane protein OmpA-like peptidoglycan-associated protein [Parabacteroides faecis]GGK19591.1 hypothetical protein GCM10007084_48670 [Parabacteroides faecis]